MNITFVKSININIHVKMKIRHSYFFVKSSFYSKSESRIPRTYIILLTCMQSVIMVYLPLNCVHLSLEFRYGNFPTAKAFFVC